MKRRIIAFVLCLICLFALTACKSTDSRDFLAFTRESLSADISYKFGSTEVTARVTLLRRDGGCDYSVKFLSPSSLDGITAEEKGGAFSLAHGDMKIKASRGAPAIVEGIVSMFLISDATLISASTNETHGERVTAAAYKLDGKEYKLYFHDGAKYPHRMESGGVAVDIDFR